MLIFQILDNFRSPSFPPNIHMWIGMFCLQSLCGKNMPFLDNLVSNL